LVFTPCSGRATQADNYVSDPAKGDRERAENPRIVRERIELLRPSASIRSGHIVIFRDEDDHLDIIRVRHGRRIDDGAWRDRVGATSSQRPASAGKAEDALLTVEPRISRFSR
jgi:plasmid stabilization system protein ParE